MVAVWEFVNRSHAPGSSVNGMKLRAVENSNSDSDIVRTVVAFAEQAALALGYIQGPTHIEVLVTADGPKLQDAGWRCHGGLGTWLPIAQECIGEWMNE